MTSTQKPSHGTGLTSTWTLEPKPCTACGWRLESRPIPESTDREVYCPMGCEEPV
jgi:hypothetical protein